MLQAVTCGVNDARVGGSRRRGSVQRDPRQPGVDLLEQERQLSQDGLRDQGRAGRQGRVDLVAEMSSIVNYC